MICKEIRLLIIIPCNPSNAFNIFIKGTLDKFNIIPQLFPKKVGIFIPLEVLA